MPAYQAGTYLVRISRRLVSSWISGASACSLGHLEYIHNIDDRYDHDVDELMA
jgi:hypothetical protein